MFDKVETYDANGNLISIVDTRDLSYVISDRSDSINNYRDEVINNGMYYMGHWWGSDARARGNITGAITTILVGVQLPSNFVWRDNDNINVPMNSTQLITLGTLMGEWVQEVYTCSWQFKADTANCTTLDAFDALPAITDLPWPNGDMDGTRANAIAAEATYTANTVSS